MGYNLRNKVTSDEGNPGNLLTLALGIHGGITPINIIVHDSLTSVTTLNGDHTFTSASTGPAVIDVVDATNLTPGVRYWIWDTVTYDYESFVVSSKAANTVTTMNESGLSKAYTTGAVISSTGPIDDAYRCVIIGSGQAGEAYAVILCDEDPSAIALTDLWAVPPFLTNWMDILLAEAITNKLSADLPIQQSVPTSRYLAIVCSVDFIGTDDGESISAAVYRKRAASDQYVSVDQP